MLHQIANIITNFGDISVLFPFVVFGSLLVGLRCPHTASIWLTSVLAVIVVTAAAKIFFMTYGTYNLHSPSGHIAISTMTYGSIAIMFADRHKKARLIIYTVTLLGILAIALSRLYLHAHSIHEIVIGAMIGLTGLWLFRHYYREPPNIGWHGLGLGLCVFIGLRVFCVPSNFEHDLETISKKLTEITAWERVD